MSKLKRGLSLLLLGAVVASCGGGGGGGETVSPPPPTPVVVNGQVLSSFVKGVFVCLPDNSYCVQTDSYGKFSIEIPDGVASLNLNLLGANGAYYPLGVVDITSDKLTVYPTALTDGNTTAAAVLRTFIHTLGGDFNNTLLFLDLSGVKIEGIYDESGNPLPAKPVADLIREGKVLTVKALLANGTAREFVLDPDAKEVKVCDGADCKTVSASAYRWLVLLYIMGDNNLSTYAWEAVNQLAAAEYAPQLKFVALVDTAGYGGIKIYRNLDNGTFALTAKLPEADTANATYLYNFVKNEVAANPADRLALILWDHGAAWLGYEPTSTDTIRLAGTDDTSGTTLYMHQLREVLQKLKEDGINVELIGFDECLMSSLEVAYDVSVNAKYLVASEYLEPGTGWNYTIVVNKLSSIPDADGWTFAKLLVDAYRENYEGLEDWLCPNGICTLAAYSTATALKILNGTDAVASYYLQNIAYNASLYDAYLTARNTTGVLDPDTQIANNSVDLYHFALNLRALAAANGTDTIVDAVDGGIYSWSNDDRFKGISIYFPLSPSDDDGWAEAYYSCTPENPCLLEDDPDYYNPFANTTWAEFVKAFVNR